MSYRKKSATVEAFQLGAEVPPKWFGSQIAEDGSATLATFLGALPVRPGDYVVRTADGAISVVAADEFERDFEPVIEPVIEPVVDTKKKKD